MHVPIEVLPDELIMLVTSFLDGRDLLSASQVCVKWRYATTVESYWETRYTDLLDSIRKEDTPDDAIERYMKGLDFKNRYFRLNYIHTNFESIENQYYQKSHFFIRWIVAINGILGPTFQFFSIIYASVVFPFWMDGFFTQTAYWQWIAFAPSLIMQALYIISIPFFSVYFLLLFYDLPNARRLVRLYQDKVVDYYGIGQNFVFVTVSFGAAAPLAASIVIYFSTFTYASLSLLPLHTFTLFYLVISVALMFKKKLRNRWMNLAIGCNIMNAYISIQAMMIALQIDLKILSYWLVVLSPTWAIAVIMMVVSVILITCKSFFAVKKISEAALTLSVGALFLALSCILFSVLLCLRLDLFLRWPYTLVFVPMFVLCILCTILFSTITLSLVRVKLST